MNRQTLTNISKAITTGSEKGKFVLPKGVSGKVKLAPRAKPGGEAKEVCVILVDLINAELKFFDRINDLHRRRRQVAVEQRNHWAKRLTRR